MKGWLDIAPAHVINLVLLHVFRENIWRMGGARSYFVHQHVEFQNLTYKQFIYIIYAMFVTHLLATYIYFSVAWISTWNIVKIELSLQGRLILQGLAEHLSTTVSETANHVFFFCFELPCDRKYEGLAFTGT